MSDTGSAQSEPLVYVIMITEMFIEYFCNIKLCCLFRFNDKCLLFTEKLFVLKHRFIFIALGYDTSSHSSREGQNTGSRPFVKVRSLPICSGQSGNYTLSKTKTIKY